jgi:hypothetical protein
VTVAGRYAYKGVIRRADPEPAPDLDSMTKAELLDHAAAHNIDVQASMSKADILAAVKKAG